MPKGNARRKHKLVVVVEFTDKLNEREALEAANEAMKGDGYGVNFARKVEGTRGVYQPMTSSMTIVRVERGDL